MSIHRRSHNDIGPVDFLIGATAAVSDGMPKTRMTLTIDEAILRAVEVKAARLRRSASELIEEALRGSLRWEALDDMWSRSDLSADEAMELVLSDSGSRPHL